MSSSADWSLVALAVVSINDRPLLSQLFLSDTATPDDELRLQFLVHSSLDVCEEVVSARNRRDQLQAAGATGSSSSPNPVRRGGGPSTSGASQTAPPYTDPSRQHSCFLDRLLQDGRYWSWGYQSNTSIRVVAVAFGEAQKETMRVILRSTYEHVSAAVCNPFRDPDAPLDNTSFLNRITTVVQQHTVIGKRLMMLDHQQR